GGGVFQYDDNVGGPAFLFPADTSVADIGSSIHASALLQVDDLEENHSEMHHKGLVGERCKRRHDVNSFPNLVVLVGTVPLSLLDKLANQVLIQDQKFLGNLILSEKTERALRCCLPGGRHLGRNAICR